MGISRAEDRKSKRQGCVADAAAMRRYKKYSLLFASVLLCCWLCISCTSIRPVIKIGLLASFEGLHRRSGYAALTAMRQAIADYAPAAVAIMPLAVDAGADPIQAERAVRKLLQDRAVRGLIGPFDPGLAYQIDPVVAAANLPWWMPLAVDRTGAVVTPDRAGGWAMPLLVAAAAQAQRAGYQRLVLAGWTLGWPQMTANQDQSALALPLVRSDQLSVIQPTDAVLWLGSPEAGARYFTALRAQDSTVPFFLGPQADHLIFSEHTQIIGPVSLLFWVDDDYEQWQAQYGTTLPTAYLTYRATQQAIAHSLGQLWPPSHSWRVQIGTVSRDGLQ